MSEFLKRCYGIATSYIPKRKVRFRADRKKKEKARAPEKPGMQNGTTFRSNPHRKTPYPGYPKQIIEDLANFNLRPPASFEDVKKARNQEIKKYHPDKHANHPEKCETAKEILQIYNASYERLKRFYEKQR